MKLLITLPSLYVLIVFFFFIFQKNLIFFPTKHLIEPPPTLNVKEVFFETENNEQLHAWWVKTDEKAKTVLFFHGNAGNVSHRTPELQILKELRLNVLIFDYRGYGRSTGKITKESDLYVDGQAAWDFLVNEQKIAEKDIILWGKSIGGGVASEIAQNKDIFAVVFESSFFSAEEMARYHYWFFPVKWFLKFKFESGKKVKNITSPVLVIHSERDEIIPFSQGQKLYEAAPEPKTFLQIHGKHNEGMIDSREEFMKAKKTPVFSAGDREST